MNIQTADLCDANEGRVRIVMPMFRSYGGRRAFEEMLYSQVAHRVGSEIGELHQLACEADQRHCRTEQPERRGNAGRPARRLDASGADDDLAALCCLGPAAEEIERVWQNGGKALRPVRSPRRQDLVKPGQQRCDAERSRHQDGLVDQRALGHRPHHRQFAVGLDAADLLGIQGQVVAEHAGGLLGGDFGHHADVVQQGGDVVEQGEKAGRHWAWKVGSEWSEKGTEGIMRA